MSSWSARLSLCEPAPNHRRMRLGATLLPGGGMLISISSDSMLDSCSEAHWLGAAADAHVGGRTISDCTDHQRTSATDTELKPQRTQRSRRVVSKGKSSEACVECRDC